MADYLARTLAAWAEDLWVRRGAEVLLNTLVIASAAIIWAGCGAALLLPLGSRALAKAETFGIMRPAMHTVRAGGATVGLATRGFFVLARSVPEYIYAWPLYVCVS